MSLPVLDFNGFLTGYDGLLVFNFNNNVGVIVNVIAGGFLVDFDAA